MAKERFRFDCPICNSELLGPIICDRMETDGLYWCLECKKNFRPNYRVEFLGLVEVN